MINRRGLVVVALVAIAIFAFCANLPAPPEPKIKKLWSSYSLKIGPFGVTPQMVKSLREPRAYVRDSDHDVTIGPMSLSAARNEAKKYDPDIVEVIDENNPAFADIDETAKERLNVANAQSDRG